MQTRDGAKVYAEHGSFDRPAYGYGTRRPRMGIPEDITAGRRDPASRKGAKAWNGIKCIPLFGKLNRTGGRRLNGGGCAVGGAECTTCKT